VEVYFNKFVKFDDTVVLVSTIDQLLDLVFIHFSFFLFALRSVTSGRHGELKSLIYRRFDEFSELILGNIAFMLCIYSIERLPTADISQQHPQ